MKKALRVTWRAIPAALCTTVEKIQTNEKSSAGHYVQHAEENLTKKAVQVTWRAIPAALCATYWRKGKQHTGENSMKKVLQVTWESNFSSHYEQHTEEKSNKCRKH